ncbi:MAG: glutamine--fructose-6-phosphate transaminase (isomerizing) [bacterium]|jgi:glucosamine--fructose-6-phosphate aminotransferase (isomerizing)|nr:glutamine--fructose-6-phosphate transaminase (isomerizing) [bacterium]
MCGIIGYLGDKDITSILLVGLERLSYRGYDSSGIAIVSPDAELSVWKEPGKLTCLTEALKGYALQGNVGIGHTRWATHGQADKSNAHPHTSQNRRVAIVHNGIIENYAELKKDLVAQGVLFQSQTDSEVIVQLIEQQLDQGIVAAVEATCQRLVGSFAIAVVSETHPDTIVVARHGSPLMIGCGGSENYISSDINALLVHTKSIIALDDYELAVVTRDSVQVKRIGGDPVEKIIETIQWDASTADKDGYPHYMLKEIYEQPTVIKHILSKTVNGHTVGDTVPTWFKHLRMGNDQLAKASRFMIQACGTSRYAGMIGKYLIEQDTHIPVEVDMSSEFRYRGMINDGHNVVIGISQSGETADTLACLRMAKSKFFPVLSFVNVKGSSMDRESDGVIYTHAGQEVGVASTKNYVAQLLNLYLFSLYLAQLKWTISPADIAARLDGLSRLPAHIETCLAQSQQIQAIANRFCHHKHFLFIGRGMNYPSALEGALKLKEISYIHATGYAAGELKHGPIALIDEHLPVVCLVPQSSTYDKMIANIEEVKARNAQLIIIATEGDERVKAYSDHVIYIPNVDEALTPILMAIPLQLLAYYTAVALQCDVDQPRNLAKSVTVE